MRKKYIFGKKLYISILTSILVLLTTVATTFAWVGVFANSTFEQFDISIRSQELEEYSIEISTDGINFTDYISFDSLKKQILLNWGYSEVQLSSKEMINYYYSSLLLDQCTMVPNIQNNQIISFGQFTDVHGEQTSKYYKFDLYISAVKNYDSDESSDFYLNAYLDENLFIGKTKGKKLLNPVSYPSDYINPYDLMIQNGTFTLPDSCRTVFAGETITYANTDSASACRLGIEKYAVVNKYHPEEYGEGSTPQSGLIFQTGYEYPIYDESSSTYSFGAILPNSSNFATINYNISEWQFTNWKYWTMDLPNDIWATRGVESLTKDIYITKDTNRLINSSNPNEMLGVNQMMKLSIYFWFEGWDADCWNAINASPVDINISFLPSNSE